MEGVIMSVSLSEVDAMANEVNRKIADFSNDVTSVREIEKIVEEVHELSLLWDTSGGREQVNILFNFVRDIVFDKLSSEIYNLTGEKAEYTVETVDTF